MNFLRIFYTHIVFIIVVFQTYAQEEIQGKFVPHHTLGLIISHTNVSQGVDLNGIENGYHYHHGLLIIITNSVHIGLLVCTMIL
jgi:hypothetical protein